MFGGGDLSAHGAVDGEGRGTTAAVLYSFLCFLSLSILISYIN